MTLLIKDHVMAHCQLERGLLEHKCQERDAQKRCQDDNAPRLRGRSWLIDKGMMKESKALRTFPSVPAVLILCR